MDKIDEEIKEKLEELEHPPKKAPLWRQYVGILVITVLGLSIPITMFLNSQEQDIRQSASELSTPLTQTAPQYTLIMLAGDHSQLDSYQGLQNPSTTLALRSVQFDPTELSTWDTQNKKYFYTIASSDFPAYQSKDLYNYNISSIQEVASRNANMGFYLHETLTYLASINGWDWNRARDTFDYAWMDQVVAAAKANNKKVIWSEPSHAWEFLYKSPAVQAKLAEWGNTIVPMYATNFSPPENDVAKEYATLTSQNYGMDLGQSHQGWYFRRPPTWETPVPTREGSLALAMEAYNAGAKYYQFEGAPADFLWDSPYMLGIRDFANYLNTVVSPTNLPTITPTLIPTASAPTNTPFPTSMPTRTPTPTQTPTAAPLACTAPVITSFSDTNKNGGGTVSFAWNKVTGADQYTIERRDGSRWKRISNTTGNYFKGSDASNDPNWRVYVSKGSCKPIPSPATTLDP